jgi:AraC-like DNA-binding protein
MSLPVITSQNVAQLMSKETFFDETVAQIQKDFNMSGVSLTFTFGGNNSYQSLLEQLLQQVELLLAEHKSKLQTVLYRIDLAEKKLLQAHANLPHLSLQELITQEILIRELKKVMTRNYFKNLDSDNL